MPRQWLTHWILGTPQRGLWTSKIINSWCQGRWGLQELTFFLRISLLQNPWLNTLCLMYLSQRWFCCLTQTYNGLWLLSTHPPLHLCHHPPPFNPSPCSWLLVPFCDPFSLTRAFCVIKRLEKSVSSQLFRCSRLLKICEHYQMCFAGEPLTEWTSVTATRRCWSWKIQSMDGDRETTEILRDILLA